MLLRYLTWVFFTLESVVSQSSDSALTFTSGVTNPAPVRGQPFTLTWTGGRSAETVYIVLVYLFPNTPNQVIPYGMTDILSNAPNNGSWTYNVPLDLGQGRYYFSIGENPFLLSSSTEVFTIAPYEISSTPPSQPTQTAISSNTAYQTYNGCGLPPLPDFTYTGYQPPCTTTIDGQVETLYPIVPASDSTLFFGTSALQPSPSPSPSPSSSNSNDVPSNEIYAEALQCPTPVTPKTTQTIISETTTIFPIIDCPTATTPTSPSTATATERTCPKTGYTTFPIPGYETIQACCPSKWSTTSFASKDVFCFTSVDPTLTATRQAVEKREGSGGASSTNVVMISDRVYVSAGYVTGTYSSGSVSGSGGAQPTQNGGARIFCFEGRWMWLLVVTVLGTCVSSFDLLLWT